MKLTPPGLIVTNTDGAATRSWIAFAQQVAAWLTGLTESGTTANRPTKGLWVGRPYFDTTLGHAIWYDGSGWVDATGTSA